MHVQTSCAFPTLIEHTNKQISSTENKSINTNFAAFTASRLVSCGIFARTIYLQNKVKKKTKTAKLRKNLFTPILGGLSTVNVLLVKLVGMDGISGHNLGTNLLFLSNSDKSK